MKTDITRKFFAALCLALLFGSIGSLTACNTVEGAGKDVQKAGEEIEDAAQDAKN